MSINFSRIMQRLQTKNAIIQALKHDIILEELLEADDDYLAFLIRSIHFDLCGGDESYLLMNNKVAELTRTEQIEYIIGHYNQNLLKEFRRRL